MPTLPKYYDFVQPAEEISYKQHTQRKHKKGNYDDNENRENCFILSHIVLNHFILIMASIYNDCKNIFHSCNKTFLK